MRGYTDNRWATFNQIKDAGWHVKKGAKSALIEKWKQFAFYKENEDTGEKELAGRYPKLVGYWNVFNAEDIEGIPPENAPVHLNDRTATIAQNLEESSRCPVIESSGYLGSAAYSPATDRILIAPRETFRSDEAFTRVLLHEMTHSTGHPSALARELDTRFGSPSYAEEELVAELGSLFLSADLGIQSTDLEGEFYENHVSYLQSWMNAWKTTHPTSSKPHRRQTMQTPSSWSATRRSLERTSRLTHRNWKRRYRSPGRVMTWQAHPNTSRKARCQKMFSPPFCNMRLPKRTCVQFLYCRNTGIIV